MAETTGSASVKVSVSMPEALAEQVRGRVGARQFSGYVAEAVGRQLRRDRLVELLDDLEREHGPVSAGVMAELETLWPGVGPR